LVASLPQRSIQSGGWITTFGVQVQYVNVATASVTEQDSVPNANAL